MKIKKLSKTLHQMIKKMMLNRISMTLHQMKTVQYSFLFLAKYSCFFILCLASFTISMNLQISVSNFPSSVKILPRYLNFCTCLILVSAICSFFHWPQYILSSYKWCLVLQFSFYFYWQHSVICMSTVYNFEKCF